MKLIDIQWTLKECIYVIKKKKITFFNKRFVLLSKEFNQETIHYF